MNATSTLAEPMAERDRTARIGLAFGLLYYVLFVVLIRALNIPTPGREPEVVE